MRVVSLFSGGKDSTYATFIALQKGWEVKYLVTVAPKRSDSWMFHFPCVELTKLQAESMGIEHIFVETSGVKEKELMDLKKALETVKDEVEGVVCGAIRSEYQKRRVDMICERLGLKSFAPLWYKAPERILIEEVNAGFEIIITSVSCDGLTKEWIGRILDKKNAYELIELSKKYGFDPAGEGGEYETFVINCPMFKRRIKFPKFEVFWDEKTSSGMLELLDE